ncbi:isocitrate lyase/phosphoenolpyruvate mutase family protein [Yokenella regensburgei]|uniref:isocitrate lyase/PEP mutase family protein n=1 Tax=Yokenella regensburgei TaxID=158877 RepID=UPI003F1742DD
MNFTELHARSTPLLIANVWDVASAKAAQYAGFNAVGTSSAALADIYGYPDGEGLSFSELHHLVQRLLACCTLPLTVDMEYGYGANSEEIVKNVLTLAEAGVAGINLEDSLVRQGERTLQDATEFALLLRACRQQLARRGLPLFINVRTDTFLLGLENACEKTLARGMLYAEHGADGLFVPGLTEPEAISAIVQAVPLPLNVMCMPALADFTTLKALGVKRISMGNVIHQHAQASSHRLFSSILNDQSFEAVFAHAGE